MEEATASYQAALAGDEGAVRFLLARKIDRALADTFRVGVVAEPLPGHERFRGFMSIPYLDRNGFGLTLRFRCLREHDHREEYHGKYMSVPDDIPRMFNVRAVHEAEDEIHVAEGEFDAMILNKVGLPAVAIPGAQVWRPHHRRMLAGFSRVWVWGDPDDAGADLVNKITRSLKQAKGVRLSEGDVTDTYIQGGADALLSLIEDGV